MIGSPLLGQARTVGIDVDVVVLVLVDVVVIVFDFELCGEDVQLKD